MRALPDDSLTKPYAVFARKAQLDVQGPAGILLLGAMIDRFGGADGKLVAAAGHNTSCLVAHPLLFLTVSSKK
jgi:hypothetical protein